MNPELFSLKSWCLARAIQKCSYTKSIETMQHSMSILTGLTLSACAKRLPE